MKGAKMPKQQRWEIKRDLESMKKAIAKQADRAAILGTVYSEYHDEHSEAFGVLYQGLEQSIELLTLIDSKI